MLVPPITPPPIVQLVGAVSDDSLQVAFTLNKESEAMARRVTAHLPRGVKIATGGFEEALVGTGRIVAALGDKELVYDLKLRVAEPGVLTIKTKGIEPWPAVIDGRKLTMEIPSAAARLTSFKLALGPAAAGRRSFVTRHRCPKGGYKFAVRVRLKDGAATTTAASRCP